MEFMWYHLRKAIPYPGDWARFWHSREEVQKAW